MEKLCRIVHENIDFKHKAIIRLNIQFANKSLHGRKWIYFPLSKY